MENNAIKKIWENIYKWTWSGPIPHGGKGPKEFIRIISRLLFILAREFQRDAITLRASALTYTVVLSLVPVLALGTAVLKGLGAGDQMKEAVYRFIDQFETEQGLTGTGKGLSPPSWHGSSSSNATASPSGTPESASVQARLSVHLRTAVDKIFDYVDRTNFATLGVLGILGVVFTVISLLSNIEHAMNVIWQTRRGRSIGRKIMDYLALMILLPLSVNVGLGAMAALQSPSLLIHLERWFHMAWLGPLLLRLFPAALVVTTFVLLYRFLPNTKVNLVPALVGGIFGGVLWIVVQALYIKLQIGVARYNAIYGSFATVPLFLIWIYTGWLVFLSGAELSYAVQVWRRYFPGKEQAYPFYCLRLAYDILIEIFKDFNNGKTTDYDSLVQRLASSDMEIRKVTDRLKGAALVREIQEDGSLQLLPSRPPETLGPDKVFYAICGRIKQETQGGKLARLAADAAREVLGKKTMADMLRTVKENPISGEKRRQDGP